MFISYKNEIYNLALVVKVYRYTRFVNLIFPNDATEIECDNKQEAERVIGRIEEITQPANINK